MQGASIFPPYNFIIEFKGMKELALEVCYCYMEKIKGLSDLCLMLILKCQDYYKCVVVTFDWDK